MKNRYEDPFQVLFWNNEGTLVARVSRDRLQPCKNMMEHYIGQHGVVGIAIHQRDGVIIHQNGTVGQWFPGEVFNNVANPRN